MAERIELNPTGERLDRSLVARLAAAGREVSRSEITRALAEGRLRLLPDGTVPKAGLVVDRSLTLEMEWLDRKIEAGQAEAIPLDIVYEDGDLLVLNKPQGLVVHPAPGHRGGTLVNALLHHCGDQLSDQNGHERPGIVHRIDKDTSGLLVVAKTNRAHSRLAHQLEKHEIRRVYQAVVFGSFAERTGRIEAPIGRDPHNRQKMAVVDSGKPAITHFAVEENLAGMSRLRCDLETGRTHQIRVHLQFVGHPVVGDPLYAKGRKNFGLAGQLLHAAELYLTHPITGEELHFTAPLPEHFEAFLAAHR